MAVSTHICTNLMNAQGALTSGKVINFNTDTFNIMAIKAGSGQPNLKTNGSSPVTFVSDVTATNAEDTAIGARQGVTFTWANDASGTAVDWSFSTVTYAQNAGDDGLTRYFVIYDNTVGAGDTTHPVVCIIDPGQLVSVTNNSLQIQSPAAGLIQFTGGG